MLGLSTDGHPLAGGFHYRFCVISYFPHPKSHPSSYLAISYLLRRLHGLSFDCRQISLQADWLCLCSLQASVHIYTVTYRVTYRHVCTYYIVGHYRDTTQIRACLFNELTHKLTGGFRTYLGRIPTWNY